MSVSVAASPRFQTRKQSGLGFCVSSKVVRICVNGRESLNLVITATIAVVGLKYDFLFTDVLFLVLFIDFFYIRAVLCVLLWGRIVVVLVWSLYNVVLFSYLLNILVFWGSLSSSSSNLR